MSVTPRDRLEDGVVANGWRGVAPAIALCLLFLIAAIPLIWIGYSHGRGASDQFVYHLGPIRDFAAQWPHFDFSDYTSATTPGYHVAVATAARFGNGTLRSLQLTGALFTVGLLATLGMAVGRRAGFVRAVLLCLPVICSLYVFASGVWLLPDSAGWWAVAAVLLVALRRRVNGWTYLLGGLLLLAVVLVHQSALWVAAPLCVAAWIGSDRDESSSPAMTDRRWRRATMMVLATTPALGVLACFVMLWHGLVPPNQKPIVSGINPAGPAMLLAVTGAIGIFFAPLLLFSATSFHKFRAGVPPYHVWRIMAAGALLGFICGAAPVTTYDVKAGRFSGLWNAGLYMPSIWHRSPMIIGLATLGGVVVALWLAALQSRERWIWASAVVAVALAQTATHNAFQRYDEPLILIVAAISLARFAASAPRWAWAGPLLLSAILAGITVMSLR